MIVSRTHYGISPLLGRLQEQHYAYEAITVPVQGKVLELTCSPWLLPWQTFLSNQRLRNEHAITASNIQTPDRVQFEDSWGQ